ncbi:hypothetical protein Y032_0926g3069 [Ancylostoma ceylanicum]|uniref:Aldehyde dehydrogenase domain-containing protein n=1 Tax=Ancylostoma ceylanicum TaxID=53326 RepID=A0A016W996_9BILA|nr:hypothetical protein Y032_0926g3069 [Ancylostoma ceylanicum]
MWAEEKVLIFDLIGSISNNGQLGFAAEFAWCENSKKLDKEAVRAARDSFPKWSLETTPKQRGAILRKWFDIFVAKETELAQLLTLEQGKPLVEARGEIQYSAAFFDWYAGEARRIYGQVVTPGVLNREHVHIREPIGVAAFITPWNFPTAMIARKAAAALAAGCTIVVKPAQDTPLSALAMAQTAEEAGLPPGVFNVIPADHSHTAAISKYICSSTDVDVISFTGSTAVGKLLLAQSASTVKRVCLELGGSAPVIVFESADLGVAVKGCMAAKFRGSGQTCVAANRFFVHQKIHDDFITKMIVAMKGLTVGDGMDPKTTIGPLINDAAVKKTIRTRRPAWAAYNTVNLAVSEIKNQKLRAELFNSTAIPALCYESKTWTLTKAMEAQHKTTQASIERRSEGLHKLDIRSLSTVADAL